MDAYEIQNGTAGQRARAEELVRLAYAEFEGSLPDGRALLPGEVKMLRGAAMGEEVDLASERGDDRRLWFAPYRRDRMVGPWERWGEHRTIRAAVLRWMCSFEGAKGLVDPHGVRVRSAYVVGELNLDGIEVDFAFGLYSCVVSSGIRAEDARLASLVLDGSVVHEINADLMRTTGIVCLGSEFRAFGKVQLVGVTIGGNLECRDGRFEADEEAITADGIKVAGDVFFDEEFRALGEVRLLGATIGGDLYCDGGGFDRAEEMGLNLEGLDVHGTFNFEPNSFVGEISLMRARVGYLNDSLGAWPERVCLTDFWYRAIYPPAIGRIEDRLKWLAKSDATCKPIDDPNYLPDPQPYRQLAKVLRAQGHEEDARRVMRACARRRAVARFHNQIAKLNSSTVKQSLIVKMVLLVNVLVGGVLRVGYGAVAGHGYNRWRPFYWMVGLVLLGGFVFSGYRTGEFSGAANPKPPFMQQTQALAITKMQSDEPENLKWLKDYPAFRPLAYSADTFLPLVNLHQESYWTPKDGFVKRVYLPFHILMGWVVTTLAAVSVTGLVRHEKE